VSQRFRKTQTTERSASDTAARVLIFKLFKTVDKSQGVSDTLAERQLKIYEVFYGELIFGYLYITSDHYSLVWRNVEGFNVELPFSQIELQFSNIQTWRIEQSKPLLPLRNHPMELKGYDNKRVKANIFFIGEDDVKEFDLLSENGKSAYRAQVVENPESISRITFARYDSEILFKGELQRVCFTAERIAPEASDDWEFVINVSRRIVLNPRSLRWVMQNHELRKSMLKMDFEASHIALSGVLSR
jgi:hypothetical protein